MAEVLSSMAAVAKAGEVAGSTSVSGAGLASVSVSDISGICGINSIKEAQKGLSAIFPNTFNCIQNYCQNLIVHQTAGEIGSDNEITSLMSRAAAVYACGELKASPEKISVDARNFDTGNFGKEVEEAVNKLSKHENITQDMAKAMAYSAFVEVNKISGNGDAQLAVGTALNALNNAFNNPDLTETQIDSSEDLSEFKKFLDNDMKVSNLPHKRLNEVIDAESLRDNVLNSFRQIDRDELSPREQELFDLYKNVDMDFLQECADNVNDVFKLPQLPMTKCDGNFFHCQGETRSPFDDFYGGDPEFVKEFIVKIADMHPEISMLEKAKIFTCLIYAHEASHYMFSQCAVKFPRAVEELACDIMTRAYAIKSNIASADVTNDILAAFYKNFNNQYQADDMRVFVDGIWKYPSTIERCQIPEETLGKFVGTFRDFAPNGFLPGNDSFNIAKVGLYAAKCMNLDLIFKPNLNTFEVAGPISETGINFSELALQQSESKIWVEDTSSFIEKKMQELKDWAKSTLANTARNKAFLIALARYIQHYC